MARELRRDLDHGLVDEYRHRVQVARVRLQAQALRLQGNCPAAGKGVVYRGWVSIGTKMNEPARRIQHILIVAVLPLHQGLNEVEEPPAGRVLGLAIVARRKGATDIDIFLRCLRVVGIVHEGGEEHCPSSG